MEALQEDTGDGSMICTEHPYKNNTPAGGICAFCLQEKLGKLVSSSFPIAVFPSSCSSSPSFRSDPITVATTTTNTNVSVPVPVLPLPVPVPTRLVNTHIDCQYHHQYPGPSSTSSTTNRSRILYLLGQRKKKKKDLNIMLEGDRNNNNNNNNNKSVVFKRSKSTVTPRMRYMDAENDDVLNSHRGFWSFLHLQKQSHSKKTIRDISSNSLSASRSRREREPNHMNLMEDIEIKNASDRKVSRSRSVGCGSRSFSGDFFERISTGFGDCTLRRVESHREGKVDKISTVRSTGGQDCINERVRCGGLFSGFMVTSSSSSSSSSSNWVASSDAGKVTSSVVGGSGSGSGQQHARSKSWGWALASPMRAFSKTTSSSKREGGKKNQNPNLAGIPSLLSVSS